MSYHHGNLRRALLDRAAQVIAERGVEGLSLRALAQDLGVSHAAPARHFKNKLDMLRALATEGHRKLAAYALAQAETDQPDPIERYAGIGRAYVRFSLEYPDYYKAIRHPEVAAQADEELKAASRGWWEIVFKAAREAQAAGWIPGEPIEQIVAYSAATVRGLAAMLQDPLFEQQIGEVDRNALIERVVRLVVAPISQPSTKQDRCRRINKQ